MCCASATKKSMQFLEDVMAEIIDIFPSKYIHIGGDEAPRTRWEKCPKCQARIRTEKIEIRQEPYSRRPSAELLHDTYRKSSSIVKDAGLSAGMRFWKATSLLTQLLCHGVARQEESKRPNWDTT